MEFALVLPILLLILFGIINFGSIFAAQISMNTAVRDAARAGVVKPRTAGAMSCTQIATQAKANAETLGAGPSALSVQVTGPGATCNSPGIAVAETPCTGSAQTGTLSVVILNDYRALVPWVPPSSASLTATGSFRCEYT